MRVLVTGATGFTGGHLARHLLRSGDRVAALCGRRAQRARLTSSARASRCASRRSHGRRGCRARRRGLRGRLPHRRHLPRSRARRRGLHARQRRRNAARARRRARGRRARASCTAAPAACTVTSSSRRPTRTRRIAPGDVYQRTKLEAERLAAAFGRDTALEVVIARPIGIYGPGDTRFLKMFRGIARGRFPMLGRARSSITSPTSTIWFGASSLCGNVAGAPPAAPTFSPGRSTRRSTNWSG